MLTDEVTLVVKAGHGGPGKVSFYPGFKSGPDGGNGGRGGNVYIEAISDLTALNQFAGKKIVTAEDGQPGGDFTKTGRDGQDLILRMPIGTILIDEKTQGTYELNKIGEKILIAEGGIGGRGNARLANSRRTTPEFAQPGLPGQEKTFEIILRLIADYGLIGLPNSGKSSLLNELTLAKAIIGDYPFTTLEPNLGVLDGKIIADIPGLIEGASAGKGLGIKFLKHIEKVPVLLHTIAVDSPNPEKDYQTVSGELMKYNPELTKKKEIILLTKTDLIDKKQLQEKIKHLKKLKKEVIPVSIYDFDSIENLKKILTS